MHTDMTPIPVDPGVLDAVGNGTHYMPHAVLGAHLGENSVTIRTVHQGRAGTVHSGICGGMTSPLRAVVGPTVGG